MGPEVSATYDLVRAVLGDFNASFRKYQDTAIASVVKTVVRLGRIPGHALTSDLLNFTPAITSPKTLGLVVYHAAKMMLLPNAASYRYRLRAISEQFGEQKIFLMDLETALFELENGEMFYTFQSFYGWIQGITGVDLWAALTEVKVNAPVALVTVGPGGLATITEPPPAPPGVAVYSGSADPNEVAELDNVLEGSIYNQIVEGTFIRQWIKTTGGWQ